VSTVDLGDVQLHVDDRGQGEPPLVLVHGFTGSSLDWVDVHDDLAADRRVVAFDHRGHGQSSHPSDYSFDLLDGDLLGVVDALGLDGYHLLGHSMGGVVALRHVLAHPDRVRSLILMDTGAEAIGRALSDTLPPVVELGRSQGMPAVFALGREMMGAYLRGDEARKAELLGRIETKYGQLDVEAFNAFGQELGRYPSLVTRLGEVACPTTVLVGEDDTMLRDSAVVLAEGVPGAELVVLPGAHSPQEDDPAAWLAAVRAHLSRA
jgi:2-succinyl-6-hydroxy-2,4-cyclohexadiene-1-carboxylate synthase